MTLDEVVALAHQAGPMAVPRWSLGCFRRRSITYASGQEDTATQVIWIQSHGLTGDLRIPGDRADVSGRGGLSGCSREELASLARAEGAVGESAFVDGRMTWSDWASFQPYDKWPETGELRRIGPCMIEIAPSGAYVEDWRAQPGSAGALVGLRLISELGVDGVLRPRDGGLMASGEHVLLVLERRRPLPSGAPADQQILDAEDPQETAALVFDSEASYLRREEPGRCRIVLSTNPFAEGRLSGVLEGFERAPERNLLSQTVVTDEGAVERLWRIDTLTPNMQIDLATRPTAEGKAWLEREAATVSGFRLLPHGSGQEGEERES